MKKTRKIELFITTFHRVIIYFAKRNLIIFLLSFSLVNISRAQQYWQSPGGIREIPIQGLPDIATASYDPQGPVIYYNPLVCQQVGPLATAFFMAHEYGHHFLGHVIQGIINANNPYVQQWLTLNAENAADAYAVEYWVTNGNYAIVQAGAATMWGINNPGDRTHPPSRIRANNIANHFYQLTGSPLNQ
jgi:Zn-dependent peptidase ImmA (M78 family)